MLRFSNSVVRKSRTPIALATPTVYVARIDFERLTNDVISSEAL